jgi:hypothetical protein
LCGSAFDARPHLFSPPVKSPQGEWKNLMGMYDEYEYFNPEPDPAVFWTCNDGRTLHVSEMGIGHLQNTICMLARKGMTDNPAYENMREELKKKTS